MKELNSLLGTKTKLSTAYHPQTDGQTERTNQELEQFLRIFVNHRQDDWADWLAIAEFSYNKIHSSTQNSPFFLDTGINPRMGIEPVRSFSHETANDFVDRMKSAREEASSALSVAAGEMKKYTSFHKGGAPSFKIRDKAWLEASHYSMNRPSKKLSHKWLGPFLVVEIVSSNAIKLKLPSHLRIHPIFNVSDLRPYVPPSFPGQTSRPPELVIINRETSYEIDKILNSKFKKSKLLLGARI